jgi:hypothetical protein
MRVYGFSLAGPGMWAPLPCHTVLAAKSRKGLCEGSPLPKAWPHPDPIPRGFGLQRKEQVLPWQHTLLSLMPWLTELAHGHFLLEYMNMDMNRASSGLVTMLALLLQSSVTWANLIQLELIFSRLQRASRCY